METGDQYTFKLALYAKLKYEVSCVQTIGSSSFVGFFFVISDEIALHTTCCCILTLNNHRMSVCLFHQKESNSLSAPLKWLHLGAGSRRLPPPVCTTLAYNASIISLQLRCFLTSHADARGSCGTP